MVYPRELIKKATFASCVQVSGVRCQVSGYGLRGTGYWLRGTGYWLRGTGYWLRGTGYGFRVSGFGCRVSGVGFRVSPLPLRSRRDRRQVSGVSPAADLNRGRLNRIRNCAKPRFR
ncbi:hypothetical protein D1AOALGA4SA_128 [Olavius algarvensis Delta 1 endosymbiont]|nr:hypothetical protein D1AOALGA4SA_128 [Olavius algarvensis Delta 1 endosymbiont]